MDDCIFCKIINGNIPTKIIYKNSKVIAFMDVNPVAPFHCLVVPTEHCQSILTIDSGVMEEVASAIKVIVAENNLEDGFRIVNNCGKYGQQTVDHVHFHLMGKRQFSWPPG